MNDLIGMFTVGYLTGVIVMYCYHRFIIWKDWQVKRVNTRAFRLWKHITRYDK